ncbi:leukotriene B4 receptor 1-like [Ambystoma mexicanum]|uniref:leukotriene B4 receptor 1-like n=1 Tax=Ambystoma mexicanum TaxID=8296 RepID=UPI0037E785EB
MAFQNSPLGFASNTSMSNSTTGHNLTEPTAWYHVNTTAGYDSNSSTTTEAIAPTDAIVIPLWGQLQYVIVPSVFLGACFLLGIVGNGLVIYTILFQIGQRSFTVVLLLNMASADFIALITLPMWIHAICDQWIYGLLLCKFLTYVVYISMYASVFFISLVSVHRFLAVLFPFVLLRWQKRTIVYGFIMAMWMLALVFASPVYVFRSTVERNGTVQCSGRIYSSAQQKIAILMMETLVGFIVPFCFLSACYISIVRRIQHLKSKKIRTEKLIASVVISFFVCWFPYHVFNLMMVSSLLMQPSNPGASAAVDRIVKAGNNIPGVFAFFSSCLNPILYAFAAQSFRGGLKQTNFAKLFGQITDNMLEKKSTKLFHISDESL